MYIETLSIQRRPKNIALLESLVFFLYCNFDENMGRGWDYVIIKTNSRRKDILNPQNLRISKLVRIEIDIVI